jgi:hypothetical protein
MTDAMQQRRERRRELLTRLYLRVEGSVTEFINAWDLGIELGMDEAESRKIIEYLEEKGLVLVDDHRAGIVRMTAAGVDEVESRAWVAGQRRARATTVAQRGDVGDRDVAYDLHLYSAGRSGAPP